LIMDM